MKEIAIKNGVPNQEHGFKSVPSWLKLKYPEQFEACGSLSEKYECFICDTRFLHTTLTRPGRCECGCGSGSEISKIPVPFECKGDEQKSPLAKLQKPYDFARAKINFSAEDLENSSEEDSNWDGDNSFSVSNSSP